MRHRGAQRAGDGVHVERSAGLCGYAASFGQLYSPGGSICYGHGSVSALVGATLEMEGHGSGRAMRITKLKATWRDLVIPGARS